MRQMTLDGQWFIGVDFGLVADHTAVTVLERTEVEQDGHIKTRHNIREIRRINLGTPYTDVCRSISRLVGSLEGPIFIAADATGVGRPVIEMLHSRCSGNSVIILAVVITGGVKPSGEGNVVRVPKREIILNFVTWLQRGLLTIEKDLPHAKILLEEMRSFRFRVTVAGNETYEAWRERDHDDIVFAASLANWAATHYWRPIIPRPVKVTDKATLDVGDNNTLTLDKAWADHGSSLKRRRRI